MSQPKQAPVPQSPAEGELTIPLAATSTPSVQPAVGASPAGLTNSEAQALLAKYGYNELAEVESNPLLKFLSYFWGPIPWMIEMAAILSAVVRHWADFWIILTLLVVNAIVGFWEEYQAGNAIAALKEKAGIAGEGQARRCLEHDRGTRTGPGRCDTATNRRHRAGRSAYWPATRSKWINLL